MPTELIIHGGSSRADRLGDDVGDALDPMTAGA
jgi:hypothetical protein